MRKTQLLSPSWVLAVFLACAGCNSGAGGSSISTPSASVDPSAPVDGESEVKVASTAPLNGAIGVSSKPTVSVYFTEPIDPATVTPATFTLFRGGNQIAGEVSSDSLSASFTPSDLLASTSPYKATVTKSIKDSSGKSVAEFSWVFTTQDTVSPHVAGIEPAKDAVGVPVTTAIAVTFSEEMDPSTINASTFTLVGSLGLVAGTVSYSAKTALLQPAAVLLPLGPADFTATIAGSVADAQGNALGSNHSWSFTTQDQTPPSVIGLSPADGSSGIPFTVNPTVTFNEPMDPLSLNPTSIRLLDAGLVPVVGVVSYDSPTMTAIFDPTGSLKANTSYQLLVDSGPSGVKDAAGNATVGGCLNCSSIFTTIGGWATPTNLEILDFDASVPQLAAAPASSPYSGALFSVWQQRTTTSTTSPADIWAAMYSPSTGSWTAPVKIESGTGDAVNPQLAIEPNGSVMVVFQQKIGAETQYSVFGVLYDSSLAWPAGWGTPVALETETVAASAAINPQVAAASDCSFAAVFQQKVAGQTTVNSIVANRYDSISGSWEAPVQLESGTFEASLPQIAGADNGDFFVVFQQRTGTAANLPNDIMASRYESGVGWPAAPAPLEIGTLDAQNPRLSIIPPGPALNAGLVVAVWQQKLTLETGPFSILATAFDPGLLSWGVESPIESTAGDSTLPFIAAGKDGSFHVIWLKRVGAELSPSVVVNRYSLGSGWGVDGVLVEGIDLNANQNPRIAVSANGRVMAVWEQLQGFFFSVVANEMQLGGAWDPSAVINVEGATEIAGKPQVVATPSGGFFSIFQQFKPAQAVYSIFVGEAP